MKKTILFFAVLAAMAPKSATAGSDLSTGCENEIYRIYKVCQPKCRSKSKPKAYRNFCRWIDTRMANFNEYKDALTKYQDDHKNGDLSKVLSDSGVDENALTDDCKTCLLTQKINC